MSPAAPRRRSSESPAVWQARKEAEIEQLLDRLDSGIQEVASPQQWKTYLSLIANNHSYSPTNLMLIMMQLNNPTAIRGYQQWQKEGRQVRKGERGAWIRLPIIVNRKDENDEPKLDADGKPQQKLVNFKWVKVFDISQTNGPPIPDLTPIAISGKVPKPVREALETHVRNLGYHFEIGPTGHADGFTDPEKKIVVVSANLNESEAAATLIHEIAHIELGHVKNLDEYRQHRGQMEVAAESVAYAVGATFGLDSLDSSAIYAAGWAKGDPAVMRQQITEIGEAARRILRAEPMQKALSSNLVELDQSPSLTM